MTLTIGIDIGGTFTDVVALDQSGNTASFTKVASTPANPAIGVLNGLEKILSMRGERLKDLERLVHSSTVSLNAILERKGARLGILATEGFGDLLIIGRQKRTEMYDLFNDAETPLFLCPRECIMPIPGRLAPTGEVLKPLDEAAVERAVTELIDIHKVDAIAVCYLFSFINPEHELKTREIILRIKPDLKVSLSSEVDCHIREYERLVMTTFDAYVKPITEKYLSSLAERLSEGSNATLQIMQSRGGINGWRLAAQRPITTAMSGTSAGAIGGAYSGERAGRQNVITIDIGGTSCDVALITGGRPLVSTDGKLDKYPLRQKMIDVTSIGAGGGSLAWIDEAGALRVGPQSAGANPGPACYGLGGTEPTITDASVVLGYLNPHTFGCGELTLHPELAEAALARIAGRVGLTVPGLAIGMHRVLNARMADAMRLVSIKRGLDARRFALLGLGGGGPVHAAALAQILSMSCAIIPPLPGVLCATGLLAANIEHEHSRTLIQAANTLDPVALEEAYRSVLAECAARMKEEGVAPATVRTMRFIDARYASQSYELQLSVPDGPITRATIDALVDDFHAMHERVYGHAQRAQPVVFVTIYGVQSHKVADPKFIGEVGKGNLDDARKGERRCMFVESQGFLSTPVFERVLIPPNQPIIGPAIIEQQDTTTVVQPNQSVQADEIGNLIITSIA